MLTALQGTRSHLGDDMVHVEVQHVVEEVDKLVLLELAQHLLAEQHGLLHQSKVSTVVGHVTWSPPITADLLLLRARDEGAPCVLAPAGLLGEGILDCQR